MYDNDVTMCPMVEKIFIFIPLFVLLFVVPVLIPHDNDVSSIKCKQGGQLLL